MHFRGGSDAISSKISTSDAQLSLPLKFQAILLFAIYQIHTANTQALEFEANTHVFVVVFFSRCGGWDDEGNRDYDLRLAIKMLSQPSYLSATFHQCENLWKS